MPLNLTPAGPTFFGDDVHQYLPLDVENGPLSPDASANQGHRQLFRLIKEYAPHLTVSFVNSKTWWDRNWGTPEAHMFKYLLYRGMEDILIIFNDSRAVRAEEIRADLLEANQEAELVWKDQTKTLSTRRAECRAILDPVLRRNLSAELGDFCPVPSQVASGLDRIFAKHYKPDNYLLIGKTDENAYTVQDLYADEVGILLGEVRRSYRSRAITRLGKAYGSSSIPLLSISSVSALWQICRSGYYKGQLLLLHRWIEPFAESLGKREVGCGYISSMNNFFKPNRDSTLVLLMKFYSFLLAYSTEFHLLVLLDGYVGPAPVTAGFVREQLLSEEQAEEIREAIKDRVNDPGFTYGLYRTWLNRSGLDFENQPETLRDLIQEGVLQTSLFDLMLGPRVKSFQLARYSEVYQFRELIGDLIKERGGQSTGLWWDGIDQTFTGHHPWVSTELRQDPNFILIAESWLRDAKELQGWMDHLEANTPMVNNPQSPNRVFSWKRALDVLEFGKVQGQAYDQRRRLKSDRMSKESIEECERLGLFRTRLPRFTQLYFYDFQDHEVKLQFGQSLTSTSSSRAGKAYLLSGTRLESKCGLSDVWYSYVESSWFFFEDPSHPFHFNPGPPPHPVISEEDAETISNIFDWRRQHGRPKPKARVVPSCIPEPESPEREPESPEPVTYVEGPSGGTEESGNGEATDDLGTPKVTPDAFSVSQRGSFKREPESPKSITYGGSRSGRMEECGDGELADHPDASNTDPVHDVKEEETESEDIEFDSWPANPSFNRELFQAMETFENAPDTYVPSSIPEEHELVILGSVNAMGHVPEEGVSTDEIPMEGVELSQPTESQMADVSDGGDDESQISDVSDGDDDESQMADVSDGDDDDKAMDSEEEYEPDVYSMAGGRATKAQKDAALAKLSGIYEGRRDWD